MRAVVVIWALGYDIAGAIPATRGVATAHRRPALANGTFIPSAGRLIDARREQVGEALFSQMADSGAPVNPSAFR
jgi:hypothetical protein